MEKRKILGSIMAVLAGLVGCAVWGVLFYFEVIAGIASFLIIYLAGMAYKKYGKVEFLSKSDYLILVLISLVELVATFFVCYSYFVQKAYVDLGVTITFSEAFAELFELINESAEVKNAVTIDCLVSVFFLFAGVGYYVRQEKKKKKQSEIKQTGGIELNPNAEVIPYSEEALNGGQAGGQTLVEPEQQTSEPTPMQQTEPFASNVPTENVPQDSRITNEQPEGVSVRPFNPETDSALLNTDVNPTNPNTDGNNQ